MRTDNFELCKIIDKKNKLEQFRHFLNKKLTVTKLKLLVDRVNEIEQIGIKYIVLFMSFPQIYTDS
jgi:hypothetical protein